MAKEKMVTRTIKVIKAKVFIANTATKETTEDFVTIPYVRKESEILKKVREMIETDTIKVAAVLETTVVENKYGMPESQFINEGKAL